MRKGFGEDSSTPCPKCKGEGERIFSPVPIIFKGAGFYVTDNRPLESSEPDNEKVTSSSAAESKNVED